MYPLIQVPHPGVSQSYRLVYCPAALAFSVQEANKWSAGDDGVEWWEPVPPLPYDLPVHEAWYGPMFHSHGRAYIVQVVGILSERGQYGPSGDHVRQ